MARILVPTDFSATAVSALQYANYLAIVTGYDLIVLNVHDGYGHTDALVEKKGNEAARREALDRVDAFVRENLTPAYFSERAPDRDKPHNIISKEMVGQPAKSILKVSKDHDTALIVMGGVGSGNTSTVSPLFGSVARSIALNADCPVFLIPTDFGIPDIAKVAFAFEFALPLKEMVRKFEFLHRPLKPDVRFVHVRDANVKREEEKEIELLEEILETGFPGYPVELDLLAPGNVPAQLLDYTKNRKPDLLAMGRRKTGFLKSLFVGSEVSPVLEAHETPLLVIPVRDY